MKRVLVTTIFSLIIIAMLPGTTIMAELPEFPENEEVYIVEGTSKSIILEQNSEKTIELGDLTDLMVAKVTLDTLQGKLSDEVEITKKDLQSLGSDESGIFVEGQTLTYQDLLNILLLTSDDNASKLIGIEIGKRIAGDKEIDNAEALKIFVEKLNETSGELKLSKTKFSDVTGKENTTTPVDLTILTQSTLGDKTIQTIINTESYNVTFEKSKEENKKKSDSQDNQEDQENSEEDSKEEKIVTIDNKNAYILSIINSGIDEEPSGDEVDDSEESAGTDEQNLDSETVDKEADNSNESQDEEVQEEAVTAVAYQETSDDDIQEISATTSIITSGYFSSINKDQTTGVFLTNIDNAQVAGVLSDVGAGEIGDQINAVINELKSNYGFVDLSENDAITTKYKLENAHFTSPKSISLSGIDSLKAYMPTTNSELETKLIWNEDFVKPTGENYQLLQSLEPLTQIATLEISVGDQTQSLPLYNTEKVTMRNWTDSLLKYGLISVFVILVLLILWRLIYVHNRRKVLKRKRMRRLQRKRQMQRRQLALQQGRHQSK